jgi:Na+-driven multidrug efflux pump
MNWMTVWAAIFRGKHSSWVPLVGGLFGVLGVRLLPIARLHSYWGLPLILDYGSLPGLLYTAWFLAFRRHRPPGPRDPS